MRQIGSVLGNRRFVFEQKLAPFLRKNLLGLGEKLAWDKAQGLTVLNAKHVWVWNFEVLGLGVSKNKATWQPVASWKGKLLKHINCDIETVLGLVFGTSIRCHKHKLIYILPIADK